MNSSFRLHSAIMRTYWCIEPVWAEQHLPLIQSYMAGTLPLNAFDDEDSQESEDPLAKVGYAVTAADSATGSAPQTRYALDDPELPDNSVFVLDIRGAIFKESTCCSIGTEDYCSLLNQAYANEKIIGIVCLIDSPGGQLSGTPSLYDAIRNPQKPTVSVVNEGLMASAAYWLACGSDAIYATQKTDQIGSIGVFVQFKDRTKADEQLGIKTHTIYSDRSTQKNLPFRSALAGDDSLLREDLNQAADLFREAVEQGRGEKLKPAAKKGPDVFAGGVFYASQAIELGLIDGFGNLTTAVGKVVELHQAKQTSPAASALSAAPRGDVQVFPTGQTGKSEGLANIQGTDPTQLEPTDAAAISDNEPDTTESGQQAPLDLSTNQNPNDPMFGDKHKALTALAGREASSITDEELTAVNANLVTLGITGGTFISSTYAAEAATALANLATANQTIATRDQEITRLTGEVARLGAQPGAMGTVAPKEGESTGSETTTLISETDAELARLKGKKV